MHLAAQMKIIGQIISFIWLNLFLFIHQNNFHIVGDSTSYIPIA